MEFNLTPHGEGDLLGVGVALSDGVADHHDGGPVRLQQQLARRLLQQPVERGRRTSEHLPTVFAFPPSGRQKLRKCNKIFYHALQKVFLLSCEQHPYKLRKRIPVLFYLQYDKNIKTASVKRQKNHLWCLYGTGNFLTKNQVQEEIGNLLHNDSHFSFKSPFLPLDSLAIFP
jgi:hypothetical protein